jgi:hypothetical protein
VALSVDEWRWNSEVIHLATATVLYRGVPNWPRGRVR